MNKCCQEIYKKTIKEVIESANMVNIGRLLGTLHHSIRLLEKNEIKSVEYCEHVFEPIPSSYDVRRCSYRARCIKCGFIPD